MYICIRGKVKRGKIKRNYTIIACLKLLSLCPRGHSSEYHSYLLALYANTTLYYQFI